jgi:hypothetical protein
MASVVELCVVIVVVVVVERERERFCAAAS